MRVTNDVELISALAEQSEEIHVMGSFAAIAFEEYLAERRQSRDRLGNYLSLRGQPDDRFVGYKLKSYKPDEFIITNAESGFWEVF